MWWEEHLAVFTRENYGEKRQVECSKTVNNNLTIVQIKFGYIIRIALGEHWKDFWVCSAGGRPRGKDRKTFCGCADPGCEELDAECCGQGLNWRRLLNRPRPTEDCNGSGVGNMIPYFKVKLIFQSCCLESRWALNESEYLVNVSKGFVGNSEIQGERKWIYNGTASVFILSSSKFHTNYFVNRLLFLILPSELQGDCHTHFRCHTHFKCELQGRSHFRRLSQACWVLIRQEELNICSVGKVK